MRTIRMLVAWSLVLTPLVVTPAATAVAAAD